MRAGRPSERLIIFSVRLHLDSRTVKERVRQHLKAISAAKWQRYPEDPPDTLSTFRSMWMRT